MQYCAFQPFANRFDNILYEFCLRSADRKNKNRIENPCLKRNGLSLPRCSSFSLLPIPISYPSCLTVFHFSFHIEDINFP